MTGVGTQLRSSLRNEDIRTKLPITEKNKHSTWTAFRISIHIDASEIRTRDIPGKSFKRGDPLGVLAGHALIPKWVLSNPFNSARE
ncbi:unannotated protein [freshwater metagenome]|uniref:Unannotated protein n=1 Tax=freshwater metagenome TaxID=449393 RepID=A0A6J7VKI7_9ZZZZ